MKKLAVTMLLLVMWIPLFAADKKPQENVPCFTEQDLEKYKKHSPVIKKSADDLNVQKDNKDTIDSENVKTSEKEEKGNLKKYKIPYKAYEGSAKRIIIPVTINGSVKASMLLDTGATGMHISIDLAEKLDLFEKNEGNLIDLIGGIGGVTPAVLTIVDKIQVDKLEDYFVPTTIAGELSEEFDGLIGMDFMTNYSIQIDTKKHVVVFEENPPSSNMPGGHNKDWWKNNFHQFASKRAEWRKILDTLNAEKDNAKTKSFKIGKKTRVVTVGELKTFANHQHKEADKLFNKLDNYAIQNAVPMEWREY